MVKESNPTAHMKNQRVTDPIMYRYCCRKPDRYDEAVVVLRVHGICRHECSDEDGWLPQF